MPLAMNDTANLQGLMNACYFAADGREAKSTMYHPH
jgi:hypothetical protein